MKKTILLLSTLFIFVACENDKEPEQELPTSATHEMHMKSMELYERPTKFKSQSFIASYVVPEKIGYIIEMTPYKWQEGIIGSPPFLFDEHWTEGDRHWKLDSLQFTITLNREKPDYQYMSNTYIQKSTAAGGGIEFVKLSQQFNDTRYNGGYWISQVLFSPMQYLTLTCDQDFDAQHPAGTPLDDLITANFYSAGKFIKSGYSDREAGDSEKEMTENLAKLNTQKINLHTGFLLTFNAQPEKAGIYQFKVEYKNANNLILRRNLPAIRLRAK